MTKGFLVKPYFLQETVIKLLYFLICLNSAQISKTSLNLWVKTDGFKVLPTSPFRKIYSDDTFLKFWGNHWSLVDDQ